MASFVAEFQPETDSELQLVESMAVCKWRQRRIWALENLGHCEAIRALVANDPVIAAKGYPERAWYGFIELVQNSSAMMNLSRLEARFDRQYVRAQKLLLDKQSGKE